MEHFCQICGIGMQQSFKESHEKGKKHTALAKKVDKQSRGIYIKGITSQTNKEVLEKHFQPYGKIESVFVSNFFAMITFFDGEAARKLIEKRFLWIGSTRLKIFPQILKQDKNNVSDADKYQQEMEQIIDSMKMKSGSFEDEFNVFKNYSLLMLKKQSVYEQVYADFQKYVVPLFKGSEIHFFGSSVSTLNFNSSDIDIYMYIPQFVDDPKAAVNSVRKVLPSEHFTRMFKITNTRVPIVKCVHKHTRINCDISFSNKLGVCNSKLIKYYMLFDEKVRLLMHFIKAWGICAHLKNAITNYGMIILVIFYLQQEPFLLPSVHTLQNSCSKDLHGGWNASFQQIYHCSKALESMSMKELLKRFFIFYRDFDYQFNVISPFLGQPILKHLFYHLETVPKTFEIYHQQSEQLLFERALVIQDPFVHTYNVARQAKKELLSEFKKHCALAVNIIDKEEPLHKIFSDDPPLYDTSIKMNETSCSFFIEISHPKTYVLEKIPRNDLSNENISLAWFDSFKTFAEKYFEDILLWKKSSDSATTINQNKVVLKYNVDENVFSSRNKLKKSIEVPASYKTILEQEKYVSEYMLNLNNIKSPMLLLVTLELLMSPTGVQITIENISENKNKNSRKNSTNGIFCVLRDFIIGKFALTFNTYENEQNNTGNLDNVEDKTLDQEDEKMVH